MVSYDSHTWNDWHLFSSVYSEIENAEANIIDSLVDQSVSQQIVCPVCLRLPARLEDGQVTCNCGLKFPLANNMNLKDFEATILTCSELHSITCSATPSYQMVFTNDSRIQFTSSCESCQTVNIILECQQ